jgi:hypothetical protein
MNNMTAWDKITFGFYASIGALVGVAVSTFTGEMITAFAQGFIKGLGQ